MLDLQDIHLGLRLEIGDLGIGMDAYFRAASAVQLDQIFAAHLS